MYDSLSDIEEVSRETFQEEHEAYARKCADWLKARPYGVCAERALEGILEDFEAHWAPDLPYYNTRETYLWCYREFQDMVTDFMK